MWRVSALLSVETQPSFSGCRPIELVLLLQTVDGKLYMLYNYHREVNRWIVIIAFAFCPFVIRITAINEDYYYYVM